MIFLQLYPVRVFQALDSSFAHCYKILNLVFSLRSISNDENDSGKDKQKASKTMKTYELYSNSLKRLTLLCIF